jgi:hypothetical protein
MSRSRDENVVYPGGRHAPIEHTSPALQHSEQPHGVCVAEHNATHVPREQTIPQPHGGEHADGWHTPRTQTFPAGHTPSHAPPHPSGAPHATPPGQFGAQPAQVPSARQY